MGRALKMRDLVAEFEPRDETVWDALWRNESIGRIAVAVAPSEERIAEAKEACSLLRLTESPEKYKGWDESWRQSLIEQIAAVRAQMQLSGDLCPALYVPGFVHGQSQGICDLFGAEVEQQKDGLFYVHPLPADPAWVESLEPRDLQCSMFWGAVEWIRYARTAIEGLLGFRIPVMTGPLDTVNYLLGTTALMEWMYSEPSALRRLLEVVTEVIIRMIGALRAAAGGNLHPETFLCMRGGFSLCSECRSLISLNHYEVYEAPYLRRIGEALGSYGIHSCGSWERTVGSAISDANLRAMHGQVRENDLAQLCESAEGNITLGIWPSENLSEIYTWLDRIDFYHHVLNTIPTAQPAETMVWEADLPRFKNILEEKEK